jgi:hypothetical protein
MNSDLYIEVDIENKRILDFPKKLDINWNNISGLCYLSDSELSDLSWAGHPNIGFFKYTPDNIEIIKLFSIENNLFLQIKESIKGNLSELRYHHETNGVIIDNRYQLSTSDRSKILMQGKYFECLSDDSLLFDWKSQSGTINLNSKDFIKIFKEIQKFIQKSFDIEIDYMKKIDECNTIIDLFSIDINSIEWNSNHISL